MSNNWPGFAEWLPVLLIAAGLTGAALLAIFGAVWQTRARAARRWEAFLDAYAKQEIVREARRRARQRLRTSSTRGGLGHSSDLSSRSSSASR